MICLNFTKRRVDQKMQNNNQMEELIEVEENMVESSETGDVQKNKGKGKRVRRFLLDLICLLCLLMVGFYVMPTYGFQRTIVDGRSMENNFHNKENVLVCKFSYRTHQPERFDVITFYPYGRTADDSFSNFIKERLHLKNAKEDDYYIKRVIGLPGETIQIIGADIYINGEKLEEHYGKDPIEDTGIAAVPIVLGEDEYFVLGDNRGNSTDSREIGPVKTKNIAGKVVWH